MPLNIRQADKASIFHLLDITEHTLIMSAFWRVAGLNYVQYSNIAAQTVRQALKGEAKDVAMKRGTKFVQLFSCSFNYVCLSRYCQH